MNSNTSRLGTESISKLIKIFSIPGIIGLVVVSLYNIIDRIFIGQGVGAMAISGLALTLPISNMVAAIGTLVGVGASARISIALGRNRYERARDIVAHVPMLNIIFSLIFATIALLYLEELLMLFGGSEETIPYARDYLKIVIPASVFTNICFSLSSIIRGSGHPNKSMKVILLGVILNIILDPIFLFVFDMGIEGVAIATAISMFVGSIYAILHFVQKDNILAFKMKNFRLKWRIIKNITSIGLSPFSMNFAACFVALIVNLQLKEWGGDLAIGAFGITYSYIMLIIMIILGFCQGIQPILGYNYGANNLERVKTTVISSLRITTIICVVGFLIIQIFPRQLAQAFVSDAEMIKFVTQGLRICTICLPVIAFQIVVSQYFLSIGKAKTSIMMSLSRQVIFLIPLILILPNYWGLMGIWFSIPISDLSASFLGLFFVLREKKRAYSTVK